MAENDKTVLDTCPQHEILNYSQVMPRVIAEHSKSLGSQLKELLHLSFRGNKLSPDEYYQMRLYDDEQLTMADKRQFAGQQKSDSICSALNRINPWKGVIDNKLVFEQVIRGFGLATTNTLAIVGGGQSLPKPRRIACQTGLAEFLSKAEFPLFGKPLNGNRSLGSAKFCSYDKTTGTIGLHDGRSVGLADLWDQISNDFPSGYLFQTCLEQHADLDLLTQSGIATMRVLTLDRGEGPEFFRAVIKLTGSGNVADNFWRKGNLLAPIDIETGTMGRAHSGMGIDAEIVENHPETGEPICGTVLPFWNETLDLCRTTANLFSDAVIIGFDIAITGSGPVIVEANYDPHLIMLQVAHNKGVLDAQMSDALSYVDQRYSKRSSEIRERLKQERKQKMAENRKAVSIKAA